jgi:hypothetical protein
VTWLTRQTHTRRELLQVYRCRDAPSALMPRDCIDITADVMP